MQGVLSLAGHRRSAAWPHTPVVGRAVAGSALLFVSFVAVGGLVSARRGIPVPRGAMVGIGEGAQRRLSCGAPQGAARQAIAHWSGWRPGAFRLRRRLVRRGAGGPERAGWRSCLYDGAGIGFLPPGPAPRDGLAIVSDFEKLVGASGGEGAVRPGGPLRWPACACANTPVGTRTRSRGWCWSTPRTADASGYRGLQGVHPGLRDRVALGGARCVDRAATSRPVSPAWATRSACRRPPRPRSAGPSPAAATTGPPRPRWPNGRRQQSRRSTVPAYDPAWPVAVVTAGPVKGREKRKAMRGRAGERSKHGYVGPTSRRPAPRGCWASSSRAISSRRWMFVGGAWVLPLWEVSPRGRRRE